MCIRLSIKSCYISFIMVFDFWLSYANSWFLVLRSLGVEGVIVVGGIESGLSSFALAELQRTRRD